MAKSLNKCEFIGNITKDIDLRYSSTGAAIANFSVACNDSYKNKNTGEVVETTEFVNVVAFNKLGEICGQYLKKGSKVYISGKMKTEKYQKDGQDRYSTKIVASDLLMLDSRQIENAQDSKPEQNGSSSQSTSAPQNNDFDDNIPF